MRERARVTMVTRLCAGVEHSVLFTVEKSPCSLGNPSETFAVTDWISKLTWDSCVRSLLWAIQKAPRARSRTGYHGHPPVRVRRAFVLFTTVKSSCWLGNPSELLAVTDWISPSTWVFVCVLYSGDTGIPMHAHERG